MVQHISGHLHFKTIANDPFIKTYQITNNIFLTLITTIRTESQNCRVVPLLKATASGVVSSMFRSQFCWSVHSLWCLLECCCFSPKLKNTQYSLQRHIVHIVNFRHMPLQGHVDLKSSTEAIALRCKHLVQCRTRVALVCSFPPMRLDGHNSKQQ